MQIADILRRGITEGRWQAGDTLPTLDSLVEEYGVARVTVRDAVKVLTKEGLLTPRRGLGTIVTEKARGHRLLQLETTFSHLVGVLREDRPDVTNIEEGILDPQLEGIEGQAAERYQYIKRCHLRDGVKYCVISLYLDTRIFDLAPDRFRNELALPIMEQVAGDSIGNVEQRIRFGKCDGETSQALTYPVGDPVAYIRRVIRNPDKEIIYYADVIYRADLLELNMDLKT